MFTSGHQSIRASASDSKTRPGADCGSNHQLYTKQFKLKLKKAGKTTRHVRYNLKQLPYEYRMEVVNRVQGLDLVKKKHLNNYGQWSIILYRRQQTKHPKEKEKQEGQVVI